MITPDQFFGKYDQKGIDFDGYYGFQCMDLYRQYVKECVGCPQSPGVEGAVKVWDTYLPEYFDRILNTIEAIPIKGDIIIWSTGVGPYGHIAVCKDAIQTSFNSFDQNWPIGSLCHFQPHNYNNVLGWLRVKSPAPAPSNPDNTQPLLDEITNLKLTVSALNAKISELQSIIDNPAPNTAQARLDAIHDVLWGNGWWWQKWAKIKELLPK